MYVSLHGAGHADGVHIVELVGRAGAGKSTLVKALAGVEGQDGRKERIPRATRLWSAVRSLIWVLVNQPLSLVDGRRAFWAAHHLHSRLAFSMRMPPGVHVWDEGAFRKALDNRFIGRRTAQAMLRLAESKLARARRRGVFHHFIRITASRETCEARCAEREAFVIISGAASKAPCAYELLESLGSAEPSLRLPWPSLSNEGDVPPEAAAAALRILIEKTVAAAERTPTP